MKFYELLADFLCQMRGAERIYELIEWQEKALIDSNEHSTNGAGNQP